MSPNSSLKKKIVQKIPDLLSLQGSIELIAKLSSGKSQYNPLGQMPQTSA